MPEPVSTGAAASAASPYLIAGLSALGTGLVGSLTGQFAAGQQIRFQRQMANTAVRRRVRDLIAAGLNPMLAYMQSAAVPSGAAPQMVNPDFMSSATQAAAIEKSQSEVRLTEAQREKVEEETENIEAMLHQINSQTARVNWESEVLKHESRLKELSAEEKAAVMPALIRMMHDDAYRSALGLPKHENMSAAEQTWWGKVRAFIPGFSAAEKLLPIRGVRSK